MMSHPRVSIVGAGQVGATTGHLVLLKELGEVVLIDVVEGLAQGKALDMMQAAATEGLGVVATGSTEYAAMEGSRIVVVTAGMARKPGMSRDELLEANAKIIGPIAEAIARHAPEATVIVVTNPLDVMTYLVLQRTGFSRKRVMGMAGVLDSGRLRAFIAQRLGTNPATVGAMVLGSHGDLMVPLTGSITADGTPITKLLDSKEVDGLLRRTRDAGAEIVSLLKQSSAYYAPASGIVQMVEAILKDRHQVLPASVLLEGEYDLTDVCLGVPVELAAQGVVQVVEQALSPQEQQSLCDAAGQVREGIAHLREAQVIQ